MTKAHKVHQCEVPVSATVFDIIVLHLKCYEFR